MPAELPTIMRRCLRLLVYSLGLAIIAGNVVVWAADLNLEDAGGGGSGGGRYRDEIILETTTTTIVLAEDTTTPTSATGQTFRSPRRINWDELDDLPPEWDSGIEEILDSLSSTTYWEPGLGPRAPRRVPSTSNSEDDIEVEDVAMAAAKLDSLISNRLRGDSQPDDSTDEEIDLDELEAGDEGKRDRHEGGKPSSRFDLPESFANGLGGSESGDDAESRSIGDNGKEPLPSGFHLNEVMHAAMKTANSLLRNMERDKGEKKILPKKATRNVTLAALLIEEVTRTLTTEMSLPPWEVTDKMEGVTIKDTMLSDICPDVESAYCFPHKYRTTNGECNNVKNPTLGITGAAFLRILQPHYGDGVGGPRSKGVFGDLPDPLEISEKLLKESGSTHEHLTALTAIWGQLVWNDISYTLPISGYAECCQAMTRKEKHEECLPIIKMSDYSCQSYVRSAIGLKPGCILGPREQMNFATSFIDGSSVYGSTPESADKLREFDGGFLKVDTGDLLQEDEYNPNCRTEFALGEKCLRSGDERVNDNAGLAALHTVLVREHNRIASLLESVNPHWDEETLYQESRKIIGAEIQHITYNEFLPAILGEVLTETFQLKSKGNGYHMDYNDDLPIATLNAVGNAVLPFILSLLPSYLEYYSPTGDRLGKVGLNSTYWAPFSAHHQTTFQELILGLVNTKAEKVDLNMAPNTKMFMGQDKMAHYIQMGRDHGLPTYTQVREYCGLPKVNSFEEMNNTIQTENIHLLETVYSHYNDVDLLIGGLAERPLSGAVVGPTFGCLLGQQFQILKMGDRFWYENNIPPSAFTKDQLQELRKVSLASMLCENLDTVHMIQPDVLISRDPYLNSPVTCDVYTKINIELWKTDTPALQVPEAILIQTLEKGTEGLALRRREEYVLWNKNIGANPRSPQGTAFAFSRPSREALLLSNTSLLLEYTSRVFMDSLKDSGDARIRRQTTGNSINGIVNANEFANGLTNIDVTRVVSTVPSSSLQECKKEENHSPCDHTYKYRTFNGWCNNINHPQYGKSLSPHTRFLPAQYDDAISRPRFRSVGGKPLPSPRLVSIVVHADVSHLHSRYTLALMQFGQFLDHDLTLTPVNKGLQNIILDCRACDSSQTVHPECWPIPVPRNDPYFPALNISSGRPHCIAFTRSLPGQQRLGPREQLNQNTAFLDSSQIYGQNICDGDMLREFINGRMNMTLPEHARGKNLMPTTFENEECRSESGRCFLAGDNRASEQPALAALHTMYLREHNRMVEELHKINPHWDDSTLYEEGRRIIGAMNQHITYNEFLPRIIGLNAMNRYDLRVRTEGYSNDYDPTCNPATFNEFGTAAFRFGHSLIRPMLTRMSSQFKEMDSHIRLRDGFFNSDMLFEVQMIDEMMRGLVSTPMENQDQFMSGEVTNHLFEVRDIPKSGLDLAALNIQRGRDHGIRPYNEYRVACNLKRAHTFDDLTNEINHDVIKRLKQIYYSVDDIDLFTGGLSEVPLKGALVGPTFACIIGIQFQNLKKCDRFWYETSDANVRFTEAQLAEIRKITLAKVICENCDVVDKIQKSVFDQPHEFLNERVPCRSIPAINLNLWKDETRRCKVDGIEIPLGASRRISPCTSCTCTKENAECQSLRVNNCRQLISEVGVEAVRRDNICKTQCSFALNPSSNFGVDEVLTAPLPGNNNNNNFNGNNNRGNSRGGQRNNSNRPPLPPRQTRPSANFNSNSNNNNNNFFPATPIIVNNNNNNGNGRPVILQTLPQQGQPVPLGPLPPPPPPPLPPLPPGSGQVVTLGSGSAGSAVPPPFPQGQGQTVLGAAGAGALPITGSNNNNRQPRPLFNLPSLRLPNLSDLFGL